MENDGQHHQVSRPTVDVADQLAEADPGAELLHVAVGRADRRCVEEHEVNTGDDKHAEEHGDDETETE